MVLQPTESNWTADTARRADFGVDPEQGPVLRFGSMTGSFVADSELTGGWAGTEISFTAYVGAPDSYLGVSNTISYWGVSYVGPTAESDEEQFGAQARGATGASWRTFRIRHVQTADGIEVQASMELPDGTILEDRSPLSPYPDFPAASPLTLGISGRESMVGEVSVFRPRWDPCGAMVPADGLQGATSWGAAGPHGLCLTTPVSPGLRTHHSTDGVEWVHAEPAGLSDTQLPGDLEWDAAFE